MIFSRQLREWASRYAQRDPAEGAEVLLSLTNDDPAQAIQVALQEEPSDPRYWRSIVEVLKQHPLYTGPDKTAHLTHR